MRAILKKKEDVAKLTCYAEFETKEERPDFIPGQYFYITLRPEDEALKKELTHHFTISTSPNQKNTLAFTTRLRLEESLFKRTVNEMQLGEEVEIGKIEGSFVLPKVPVQPVVFIALGIGITPYISMLRYAHEEHQNYQFTLIYSDNETESMPFLEELRQYEKDLPNFKLILTVTKRPAEDGENRRVDSQFLKEYLGDLENNLYYISGPPKAVFSLGDNLKAANIPEDSIKMDDFYGY